MAKQTYNSGVLLVIFFVSTECLVLNNDTRICKEKQQLPKVFLQNECSKEVLVKTSVQVLPTSQPFSILKNCLNCTLTLRTQEGRHLTATLYSLATETGQDGQCDLNRLDIYNADYVSDEHRLTNSSGICGCDLLFYTGFETSNDTMTLVFDTKCQSAIQHGEFNLIVTSVENEKIDGNKSHCAGQFECKDGTCIDKNLVCNGKFNCEDHSDETGCDARNWTCKYQFQCGNGQCIDKNLVCDGMFNCLDHSDEINCTNKRNGTCPGEFECKTNLECINKNLVCDGINNCGDSSDENGCSFYRRLPRVLLFALIGVASLCLIVFLVIVIILCWRYCTNAGKIASTYRRLT